MDAWKNQTGSQACQIEIISGDHCLWGVDKPDTPDIMTIKLVGETHSNQVMKKEKGGGLAVQRSNADSRNGKREEVGDNREG